MSSETAIADGTFSRVPVSRWAATFHAYVQERGAWLPAGKKHLAGRVDGEDVLLITFERGREILQDRSTKAPVAFDLAERFGWAAMTIVADGPTWFRAPELYHLFDELSDRGYFDRFDNVLFYGANMGAYGAAAYSVSAPGARALLVSPIATLDPRVTEWDDRFPRARRMDFTSRYGFAPEMTDALREVFVLYDPAVTLQAVHAALFTRPQITKLRCRWMGSSIGQQLEMMNVLPDLIGLAATGGLTEQRFADLYRARRDHKPYIRALYGAMRDQKRELLQAYISANASARLNMPKLAELADNFRRGGILPPPSNIPSRAAE